MKIPAWIASIAFCALLSLEAWTLNSVVELKIAVATVAARLDNTNHIASNKP